MDLPEYNIILLGDTNVGKTTLYNAFESGQIDTVPVYNTTATTCQIKRISLSNGEYINAKIWDTAGQENFRSITKTYFRNSNAAIICFDKDRFDSIMEWVDDVREMSPYCHFIITLTKVDSLDQNTIDNIEKNVNELIKNRIDDRSSINEANNDNNGNQTIFIPTAGKTLYNVEELFKSAAEFYLSDGNLSNSDSNVKIDKPSDNNEKKRFC